MLAPISMFRPDYFQSNFQGNSQSRSPLLCVTFEMLPGNVGTNFLKVFTFFSWVKIYTFVEDEFISDLAYV
jgi:hypothetical protein